MKSRTPYHRRRPVRNGRHKTSASTGIKIKSKVIPLASMGIAEEVLFSSATQSDDEAVVVSDMAGNIIFWDEGAERIFGYSEKEISGKAMPMLMPSQNGAGGVRFDHTLFNKASLIDGRMHELRGISKDHRAFPVEMSLLTWKFGGKSFYITIMRDITERKQMQREILEISRREQQRIGQDLHDGLCQDLAAITLLAESLRKKLARESLPRDAAETGEIAKLVAKAIVRTKFLSKGLLPVELEARGLMAALQDLANNTNKLTNAYCHMRSESSVSIRDNVVAIHLYRIAQEAVNNAIKHAKPRHIEIGLSRTKNEIILTVKDDGIGIKKQLKRKGLGLSIMYSRADTIGAYLQIRKDRNNGTTVTCSVPTATAAFPFRRFQSA